MLFDEEKSAVLAPIWEGEDLDDEARKSIFHSLASGAAPHYPVKEKKVQILGMEGAGTSLMAELLQANLGQKKWAQLCPDEQGKGGCHFWKHTPPQHVSEDKPSDDIFMIAVIRSPISHLASLYNHPREKTIKDCIHPLPKTEHEAMHFSEHCSVVDPTGRKKTDMASLEEMYMKYLQGYHKLAAKYKGKFIIVEYENLVMDTDNTLKAIVNKLGGELHGDIENWKPAQGETDFQYLAKKKILNQDYMHMEPFRNPMILRASCKRLRREDKEVYQQTEIKAHVYFTDEFGKQQSDYSIDCPDLSHEVDQTKM